MFRIALRNLLRTKLRTFFTILGVSVIISLFVLLISIGRKLSFQLDSSLTGERVDLVVQSKSAFTPLASRIKEHDLVKIASIAGVSSVSSFIMASKKISHRKSLFLFGVSSFEPIAERLGVGIVAGRVFKPGRREILLGQKSARQLGLKVGDQLELGQRQTYTISGIYSLGIDFLDGGFFLGLAQAQMLLRRPDRVNLAFVATDNNTKVSQVLTSIEEQLPDYIAVPGGELTSTIGPVSMIKAFVASISVIALAVSSIIVMNTLFMTLTEKTREIGILMAIGWHRGMIMKIVIYESLLICIVGAIVGFVLAYPALALLNSLPAIGPSWMPESPTPILMVEAVGLAMLLGGVSALYPAFYTTKLQPARTLRYE